jgi:hypothetical protein
MTMSIRKSYQELLRLPTYEARLDYLLTDSIVGKETFGSLRHLNQKFYSSVQWKRIRLEILLRDNYCDLALADLPINGRMFVHHINPISDRDLATGTAALDVDNLVTVSFFTHNRIHFGIRHVMKQEQVSRSPGDTKLW